MDVNKESLNFADDESAQQNLKTIIDYEKKIQNRVRYLAQEEKRMVGKMNVM